MEIKLTLTTIKIELSKVFHVEMLMLIIMQTVICKIEIAIAIAKELET